MKKVLSKLLHILFPLPLPFVSTDIDFGRVPLLGKEPALSPSFLAGTEGITNIFR